MMRGSLLHTVIFVLVVAGSALAQHEQAFPLLLNDGIVPGGGLITDAAGNLYGVNQSGSLPGTVFELTASVNGATLTVLYRFSGDGDGGDPVGDLTFDSLGNLYGVTQGGGTANLGTVLELSPPSQPGGPWTETVLHSFQGLYSDGAAPMAGLTMDDFGNLFGTTPVGGNGGYGTVFELSPPSTPRGAWTETVLYNFRGTPDGIQPRSRVILDSSGNLFGTTTTGGRWGWGSVFELSPPSEPGGAWTETILHSFFDTDGGQPQAGLLMGSGGTLYGTTGIGGSQNCGTVFRLLNSGASWTYNLVHDFLGQGYGDGCNPSAALIFGDANTLYGTTTEGGVHNDGTVFQITGSGNQATETTLYSFTGGSDGNEPAARLTLQKFALYGTTLIGGYQDGGVIFRLSQ